METGLSVLYPRISLWESQMCCAPSERPFTTLLGASRRFFWKSRVSRLGRRHVVMCRVSGSGVSKLSVLWSRAFCSWIAYKMPHLSLHRLDCSCLFSYFWPHVEYFFEKLVVAHVVTTFPLFYCIVRSSNISTLASRLTRFCARWIRFM